VVSGGFILNDKFSIAFFSANSPKVNLLAIPPRSSGEYSDWVEAGLSAGFLVGLTQSENQTFLGQFNNTIYDESVISLSPELGLGINLLSWWRIHTDFGYRFIAADKRIMSAADSDSFFASLSFAFGRFGK